MYYRPLNGMGDLVGEIGLEDVGNKLTFISNELLSIC